MLDLLDVDAVEQPCCENSIKINIKGYLSSCALSSQDWRGILSRAGGPFP